jgi:hypothetical protein
MKKQITNTRENALNMKKTDHQHSRKCTKYEKNRSQTLMKMLHWMLILLNTTWYPLMKIQLIL